MAFELSSTGGITHILSKKSLSLNRDTFIFWRANVPGFPSRLVVGLNQKVTHVTGAQLHHWLRILDPDYEWSMVEIRPAIVGKAGIMSYGARLASESAPVISPSDTSQMPPGDYALFAPGCKWDPPRPFLLLMKWESFKKHQNRFECNPSLLGESAHILKLYTFPPSFEETVLLRDKRCFVTGAETDLGVSWIFPPTWAYQLDTWNSPSRYDYTPFINVSNAGVMRKDLMDLFHDNAFGIDVDDDYRTVVFRDLGSVTLPSHLSKCLPSKDTVPGLEDKFLQLHFGRCLVVHLMHGDISEDYHQNDIFNYMEELGVAGDPELDMAPLNDERWNTVLGREILADVMRSKLYVREGYNYSEGEGE